MEAVCTYCTWMSDPSPKRIAAIKRWRSPRIMNAAKLANERQLEFFFLTANHGLVASEQLVRFDPKVWPRRALLEEGQIRAQADLVAQKLGELQIESVVFLASALERQSLNFLRLITLACDHAGVNLELVTRDAKPFPDWAQDAGKAKEARVIASKDRSRNVKEIFKELLDHSPEDGWILLARGEAYEDRGKLECARVDYERAIKQLLIPEYKSRAEQALDR
ncbi:MAG: hypothetical protein ACREP6_12550, partial [Candidatus Binataceae bacterium]